METVRIGKDITFMWQVRKDGRALTAEDAANMCVVIAARNGKGQSLPFEIVEGKIVAVWYGIKQTEVGDYRLTAWYNKGKIEESVVDVVWAVTLSRYTNEETYDELDPVTIELETGDLTFGVLKGERGISISSIEQTQTSEESGGINIVTITLDDGEVFTFEVRNGLGFTPAQSQKLDELPTNDELQADLNTIPNDVMRGAEDAQFVHIEPNEQPIGLFYLRKVDSQLAGLMTAADKQKMDALPTGAVIPVAGVMGNGGFTFVNNTGTPLFTIPFADSIGGGLISFADLSRFMELGTKQELDAQFAAKADKSVVDAIQALIPSQASASNQLADKDFVNSSIATSTATFRGSFNLVADLSLSVGATHAQIAAALGTHIATADNNDYAFVLIPTSDATPTEIAAVERYKFNGTAWAFEYALNNSGFTAVQWAAINSGITALLVAKLQALPTASELATAFAAKEDKANKVTEIDDDSTDTQYPSAKGVWTAIKNAIAAIKQWATSLFARTDGYYSRMIVGGAESLIGDVPQTATYTFRRTGGGAIGEPVARLTEIQGNTGVMAQLFDKSAADYLIGQTWGSGSTASRANTVATVSSIAMVAGHKYLLVSNLYIRRIQQAKRGSGTSVTTYTDLYLSTGTSQPQSCIVTAVEGDYDGVTLSMQSQQGNSGEMTQAIYDDSYINLFDLTLMYGSGNEPGTVAEFEARIWRDYGKTLDEYIAYTQGKLINCKALALESVGQNQWDEEWELGTISGNGQKVSSTTVIRTKNYIRVLPNTEYYLKTKSGITQGDMFFYDENLAFISGSWNRGNRTFTTPETCAFILTSFQELYGNTYNHDICINLSDAAINGTYKPYKKDVVNLNLTTLTGINPTTGVREVMFPNGAGGGEGWRSALRVVNGATVAAVENIEVDLGNFDWSYRGDGIFRTEGITDYKFGPDAAHYPMSVCSKYVCKQSATNNSVATGDDPLTEDTYRFYSAASSATYRCLWIKDSTYSDEATFKAAVNGIKLIYQLATPIVYTDLQYADGTPFVLPTNFEVQNDGTERITHTDGEDSIAPVMSAIYGLNAVGFIQDAPKDYTSQATLDSLVSVIASITGRTISKTWSDAQGKWVFTSN